MLRISKLHVHTFLIWSLVSGYGIIHKVSNLLIQFHGNSAPSKPCHHRADKRKRRSFFTDVVISWFGKRARPGILRYPQHEDKQILFADREQDNFIEVLLRWQFVAKQIIPNWTSFYITIHEGLPVINDLDCIDLPATDMSTIYKVSLNIVVTVFI